MSGETTAKNLSQVEKSCPELIPVANTPLKPKPLNLMKNYIYFYFFLSDSNFPVQIFSPAAG
jgi:hypothetical protein